MRKANYRIYNLFRVLKSNIPEVYIRAYKTYVRPIVESGTTVFNPTRKKDIDLLESIQNSFTRKLMMRCFPVSYDMVPNGPQRSELFGLPSLVSRRRRADLIMMFKILTKKLNNDTEELLDGELTRSVRRKLKLRVPVAKSRLRTDFLTYRTLTELNLLLGRYDDIMSMSTHVWSRIS